MTEQTVFFEKKRDSDGPDGKKQPRKRFLYVWECEVSGTNPATGDQEIEDYVHVPAEKESEAEEIARRRCSRFMKVTSVTASLVEIEGYVVIAVPKKELPQEASDVRFRPGTE